MSKRAADKMTPPVPATDFATYAFADHSAAWQFMRDCEAAKIAAGFPSVDGYHTVKTAIRTWMDRETTDRLAKGATCVAYAFPTVNA